MYIYIKKKKKQKYFEYALLTFCSLIVIIFNFIILFPKSNVTVTINISLRNVQ